MSEHKWEYDPKGGAHGEYAMKCAVCGMGDADMAADKECPGTFGDSDRDIAIGYDAFKAGFMAAGHYANEPTVTARWQRALERAWSEYDPPEHLKGGGA